MGRSQALEPDAVKQLMDGMEPIRAEMKLCAAALEDHERALHHKLDKREVAIFTSSFKQTREAYALAGRGRFKIPVRKVTRSANAEPMLFCAGRWSGRRPLKYDWSKEVFDGVEDLWHVFSENQADGGRLKDVASFIGGRTIMSKASPTARRSGLASFYLHVLRSAVGSSARRR